MTALAPPPPAPGSRSRALDRAARREREAAAVLGSTRVHRRAGQSAPDVRAVRLESGAVLGPEVKTRARLPKLLTAALDQARGYFPNAVALAVISETGGRALAVLDLRAFAALVGLDVADLPAPRKRRRVSSRQLSLPEVA